MTAPGSMDLPGEQATAPTAQTAHQGVRPQSRAARLLGWAPVGVAVLGVLIAAFLILRPSSGTPGLVGKPAPDFTLKSIDGRSVHLAALRGKVVLLNFWGVTCPPCRREMPLLQAAYTRYRQRGLVILGLEAQGTDRQSVAAFASERGITYPMLLDAAGPGESAYGIKDLPVSFLVDRNGVVREAALAPFLDAAPLQKAIEQLL